MPTRESHFPDTRWTLIDAIKEGTSGSFEALSQVCEIYWYPVYAFFRDQGNPHHDAQDLTQGFFASLLRREDLSRVQQEAGNFRAFLSASARNFATSEYWRMKAAKRGGGKTMIQIDEGLADRLYRKEQPAVGDNAQLVYDRRWAKALLDGVMQRLRVEAESKGRAKTFDSLIDYLEPNGREQPVKQVAKALGMNEGAVRVEVFRIRKRYGELLRIEIGKMVDGAAAVEAEVRYLLQLMGRDPGVTSGDWRIAE